MSKLCNFICDLYANFLVCDIAYILTIYKYVCVCDINRCKSIEAATITVRDFHQMRMLGRGAFGCVNACKKKDTGKLYAMKQINKKRVSATESAETIMSERNFLADMDSVFVTTLKCAFMDDQTLYLILDLMIGGDLKFHLNNDKTFSEDRSRFYAAEAYEGLEQCYQSTIAEPGQHLPISIFVFRDGWRMDKLKNYLQKKLLAYKEQLLCFVININ